MTVKQCLIILIACTFGFALVGGAIGFALGTYAPDYYRLVFQINPESPANLPALGLGLGVTQGLGGGLFAGTVIVACVTWYKVRKLAVKGNAE